jgi:hypothetical protein
VMNGDVGKTRLSAESNVNVSHHTLVKCQP